MYDTYLKKSAKAHLLYEQIPAVRFKAYFISQIHSCLRSKPMKNLELRLPLSYYSAMSKNKLIFKSNANLDKLGRVLGFNLSDRAPAGSMLFLDAMSKAWILLSILATPYILWLLFKLKRFGWLISFLLVVLFPYLAGILFIENELLRIALIYVPFLNLAVYLFLLKQTYPDWREPIFINRPGSDFTHDKQ